MRKSKNKVIAMVLAFGVTASMLFTSIPGALSALTGAGNRITKAEAAVEFYTKLEAEDATMTGDVKAASTRAGYSGTGYATGFTQAGNNSWSMPVTIPTEGFYTFTIRSTADSYKENFLYIDGAQTGTIYCKGDAMWGDTVIESVYLEAGTITLSIKESWGWFDLDYIEIKNGTGVEDSVYATATSTLVNPNANQKTKNIMTYLRSIYGKKTLSGQSGTLNESTEFDTLYRTTGRYPAIRLLDFIFCSPASEWHSTGEVDLALDWNEKGGLTSFQWHWHAPKGGASFYTEKTSFDLSKAVTTQNISRKSLSEIKAMYEAGTITEETYLMVRDIDAISGYLAQLEDAGVTVLWRPLHEASGGWFWWGAAGEGSYLWLYRLMFDRQTYYHELNNLIWVWNGQDADWYPGDEYCDIVGTDIYADKHNYSAQTAQFKKTVNYSGGNKMAALTENGVMVNPDLMSRDNTFWLWFGVWYGDFLIDYNGNLNGVYTEASMVNKVYNSDLVITLDELPNFNGTNPTGVPTVTPTVTPIVTPIVTPTVTPTTTPIPSGDFTLTLTNTGNTAASTNTIKNNIRLKHESGSDIDLSKLTIRYYYTKEGSASENFYCDTAALQYNKAPWYVSHNSSASGSFHSLAAPKTNADSYLELKINTTDKLTAGSTLIFDTRFTKNDWSLYNQSNDYSYGNNSNVLVYYDGELILGVEP